MSSDVHHDDVKDAPQHTPSNFVYRMQLDRFDVFKAQDEEKGHFDCAFEIHGKKLFVHKFVLATASETFNALLSDRWNKNNKDDVIKIENAQYTSECFYEFLTFLYSGFCTLTNDNVCILTDMAEFYGVTCLKEHCDYFLSNIDITVERIEQMVEFSQKYSLKFFGSSLKDFIARNWDAIINTEHFMDHKKSFVEYLAICEKQYGPYENVHEIFFDAVYKWAEHQAEINMIESNVDGENSVIQEFIKTQLINILPKIGFYFMRFNFIKESILEKRFLFSDPELYKIIKRCEQLNSLGEDCFKNLYDIKEKGFDISLIYLYYSVKRRSISNKEEEALKAVYEVAEIRVLMKQLKSPDPHFNLIVSIKDDLSDILPFIKYYRMTKKFLNEFVVAKGIITEEQANHVSDIDVEVKIGDGLLVGTFEDKYLIKYIRNTFNRELDCYSAPNILCCIHIRFGFPSFPSTVKKMKDVDWYLCIENCGLIYPVVKHRTLIDDSDYLLAEMKPNFNGEFKFDEGATYKYTFRYRNV